MCSSSLVFVCCVCLPIEAFPNKEETIDLTKPFMKQKSIFQFSPPKSKGFCGVVTKNKAAITLRVVGGLKITLATLKHNINIWQAI